MASYYVLVNSKDQFPLFQWDRNLFYGNPQLRLATDNLNLVKQIFASIQKLEIFNQKNEEVACFTEYDGFSSIAYIDNSYSSQLNQYSDELVVTLTKLNLAAQVQRLDEQVNHIIDTESMTIEEFKNYKISQISSMGEQLIFNGTEVTLLNGVTKNFTYNLEDQSNLLNAIFIIQTLGDLEISLPYHSHGEPCELYNARDILAIYFTLQFFSTRIQTEINMKLNWIRECQTKEEIEDITIDTPLPEEWAARAQAIMGPAMELAAQLQAQYFGDVEPIINEGEE